MNLKKTIILSAFVLAGMTVFAQKGNVSKAAGKIAEYEKFRAANTPQLGAKFLDEAKSAIDLAVVHEKTQENPEAWTYYALVYANLATDQKNEDFAKKAEEGIINAKKFDSEGKNKDNIGVAEQTLYAFNFNQGVGYWEKNDYKNAYNSFDKGLIYAPGDTTLTYYAAIAAIQTNDYKNGIEKYKQLIDKKDYSQHTVVLVDLPKLYLSVQDTASALEYAALAVKEYPTNNNAVIQNIELNLIVGNEKKIIADIQKQIEVDNNNKTLYYYLGIAQNAAGDTKAAYSAYKKAIEIDPNYSDANLNAAVVLINSTRDEIQALNEDKTLSNNQYTEKLNKLKDQIKPAEANFLTVLSIEANNEMALKGLKSLYDFLQLEEKSKEIQARIDAL